MQKFTNIIILLAFFTELSFGQDLKIYYEVDTIKKDLLYGVKNKKGKIVLPAKYFDIDIDKYSSIVANNSKIFDRSGNEKLTVIKENNLHFNKEIYFKNERYKIGLYSPQIGAEIFSNYRKERDFCKCNRDPFWESKSMYYIVHEEAKSYLINNKFEKLNNLEFKDGFIINNNYFLIEHFDSTLMLYNEKLEAILPKGDYRFFEADHNYIYIYTHRFKGPLMVYSIESKKLMNYDRKLINQADYLAVEQNDKFLLLKKDSIIFETNKFPDNYSDIEITYSNPMILKYGKNLYRNHLLIAENITDVRSISDSIYMAYTNTESIVFFGNKEIYRRKGDMGFERIENKIVLHEKRYVSDAIYRNARILNSDGSMVTDTTYPPWMS